MFRFLIFDLDETLYPRNAGLMQEIGVRINRYLIENLHLPQDQANELRKRYYSQHGTALRGLVVERPDVDPEDYLRFVHDVRLGDYLGSDPALAEMLRSIPLTKVIFTNATVEHAQKVLNILGVAAEFADIVDVRRVEYDFLTRLEHVAVRYAGAGGLGSVYEYQSQVPIVGSEVGQGSSYGIFTDSSSPQIEGNRIEGNASHGLYHQNGSPAVRGNTIAGNQNGIYSRYSTPSVVDNQITGNREWGIYHVDARSAPVITGNTVTGNLRAAVLPASAVPNAGDGNELGPNAVSGLWIRGMARGTDLRLEALYSRAAIRKAERAR